MWPWVGAIAGRFFLECVQVFCALRLLRRDAPDWKIASFAALQSLSTVVVVRVFPVLELNFLLLSITYLIYFIWIFEAELFPDALFAYLLPLSLHALGTSIFPPLFTRHFPQVLRTPFAARVLGPAEEFTAYLPSILLACYFVLTDRPRKNGADPSAEVHSYAGWALIFLSLLISCRQITSILRSGALPSGTCLSLLGADLVAFPTLIFVLHQYSQKERRCEKVLQYHVKRSTVQEAALRTLREERHELLNELTLISTYVEMGKREEALSSIAFSAAKLSDRHNYSTLPADAWTTVLQIKAAEAERLGIHFSLDLQAEPPEHFHEQRLLPKVIMNLLDNAFAAVAKQEEKLVKLHWSMDGQGQRVLSVSNNGPEISPLEGKRIFRGGVTSKEDPSGHHGWGLVICNRIAEELGGSLTYTSSPELTTFTLTLPDASVQKQPQVPAT